jgi:hypothetical protein
MERRTRCVAAIFLVSATGAFAAHAADCKTLSRQLLDNLDHGNDAAAHVDFDEPMKSLSAQQLQTLWQTLQKKLGPRGARDEARQVQNNGNDIVMTPLHFGDHIAKAVVVCSPGGKISGFQLRPQP